MVKLFTIIWEYKNNCYWEKHALHEKVKRFRFCVTLKCFITTINCVEFSYKYWNVFQHLCSFTLWNHKHMIVSYCINVHYLHTKLVGVCGHYIIGSIYAFSGANHCVSESQKNGKVQFYRHLNRNTSEY